MLGCSLPLNINANMLCTHFHYLRFCCDGSPAAMLRVFPLDLFVLLVPPRNWGMVVNCILEAIFLEVQS